MQAINSTPLNLKKLFGIRQLNFYTDKYKSVGSFVNSPLRNATLTNVPHHTDTLNYLTSVETIYFVEMENKIIFRSVSAYSSCFFSRHKT